MLQAIDERLSIWGWQTGTGTRFAIIIDSRGQKIDGSSVTGSGIKGSKGVGDGDIKSVSVGVVFEK